MTNWVTSPSWWKNYCSDDSDMTSRFTARGRHRDGERPRRAAQRPRRRWRTPATRRASTRSSPRRTGRRSRADPDPLPGERLDPPVHRRLRRLEPRRRLGQRHGRDGDEQHDARTPSPPAGLPNVKRPRHAERRSTGGGCARTRSACSRRSASLVADARRRRPDRVGRQIRTVTTIVGPYQLQEACTRATGASWPCATACGWPTTAAPCAAAAACARPTGSTPSASRT